MTSLTSWRAACDISARSFGLPTIYERPIVDLNSLSTQQLDLIIELAGSSVEYIVEPLTEQLTASLEKGEDKVPANCKYLVENSKLYLCQIYHKQSHERLFDLLQKLSDHCLEDLKWVHQIYRKHTAKAGEHSLTLKSSGKLKLCATTANSSKKASSTKRNKKYSERTAVSAISIKSIPNLFHSLDCCMPFNEVVNWLGKSEDVSNLLMFFEGLWTWMFNNNYMHVSPKEVLPRLIEIKEKRRWTHVYYNWVNMWGFEKHPLAILIKYCPKLCYYSLDYHSIGYDGCKWISVKSVEERRNFLTLIFKEETNLHFNITGFAAIDRRNCYNQGHCGLLLKTTPAKDGANVVLCTDAEDYNPVDMHFHKEFQVKDMHLSAVLGNGSFMPLSWQESPHIQTEMSVGVE